MLNKQTATKSNTTQPETIQQRATAKLTACSHNKTRKDIKRSQRNKNNNIQRQQNHSNGQICRNLQSTNKTKQQL